jgi:uncharacterized RDD family membrane protein YckC
MTETAPEPAAVPVGYAGLVTRAVALLIDLFAANAIAVLTGGAIDLLARLFDSDDTLNARQALAGGTVWFLWLGLYFVVFWTLTGQTPGDRVMSIRVFSTKGDRIRVRQAVLRFVGLLLAALPFGAGFLPVLVDDRRRGFHDWLAKTVVRWDSETISESPLSERVISAPESEVVVPVAGQRLSVG